MAEGTVIQFTLSQFILLLVTIVGIAAGAAWKIGKYLSEKEVSRIEKEIGRIDESFKGTFKDIKDELSEIRHEIAGVKSDIKYLQGKFDMYLTLKDQEGGKR